MNAKLQGIEVEASTVGNDEFAVEDAFCRELFAQRIEHLREVTIQGFFVAALEENFIAIAKHEDAEAIPLGLIDPVAAGGDLIYALCEHGEKRRGDGKIHEFQV